MNPVFLAADLVAITLLVFAMFVPRHGRRDMVVSFLVVNIAVFAVAAALSVSTVAAGLGLGLFGVLSIIRLRSEELGQHEVAYYFAALSLGLIGGLSALEAPWVGGLMVLVLAALFVGDHPALTRGSVRTDLVLDRAHTDEVGLRAHLERLFGGTVDDVAVRKIDLVNDTTWVTVRRHGHPRRGRGAADALGSGTSGAGALRRTAGLSETR